MEGPRARGVPPLFFVGGAAVVRGTPTASPVVWGGVRSFGAGPVVSTEISFVLANAVVLKAVACEVHSVKCDDLQPLVARRQSTRLVRRHPRHRR